MNYLKIKPVRDKKYLKAISGYGCSICGHEEAAAHHIINYGGIMGSKPSDHLTFALCNGHHVASSICGIHNNVKKWENEHELQTTYIKNTLIDALQYGHINDKDYEIAYAQCVDLQQRFRS